MNGKMMTSFAMFGLASLLFFACTKNADSKAQFIFKPAPSQGVVASVDGIQITDKELIKGIESDVFEAEMKVYELKWAKLQSLLLEKFMQKDLGEKKMSVDEFVNTQIAKSVKVSESDIQNFIKEKQIPMEQVTPDIKERIKQFIEMDLKKKAVDEWIAKRTQKSPVEVYLTKPMRPVFEVNVGDAPFKGGADAKVTIVEFSDFQCPFCSKGAQLISELEKKYGSKIKIAFKNYPLPFHTQARGAAEVALCAKEQDIKYFWKMHDSMFADQSKLDNTSLYETAKKNGINVEKLKNCVESKSLVTKIEADIADGNSVGVKSTPTFFVNGQLISGAQPIEVFSEVIDEQLSK